MPLADQARDAMRDLSSVGNLVTTVVGVDSSPVAARVSHVEAAAEFLPVMTSHTLWARSYFRKCALHPPSPMHR